MIYIVKITENIKDGFAGEAIGPLIKLRPKYKDDNGLKEHERTHVRQWYFCLTVGLIVSVMLTSSVSPSLWPLFGLAPFLHQLLYKFVRPYRCWCEVQAYRVQIAVGGYVNNDFAVAALVEKYGLGLSADKAKALLYG